jgi:hypothetical protein
MYTILAVAIQVDWTGNYIGLDCLSMPLKHPSK